MHIGDLEDGAPLEPAEPLVCLLAGYAARCLRWCNADTDGVLPCTLLVTVCNSACNCS